MDPNSSNQRWSLWTYRVYPDRSRRPSFALMKTECSRFGRQIMHSASEMHLRQATDGNGRMFWEIKVRSEGHPVHDPTYVEWMHTQWRRFFQNGFGLRCEIHTEAHLEAGSRQNGQPADQLIMMPTLSVDSSVSE